MKIRDKYGNVVGEVEDNSSSGGDGCLGSVGAFCVLGIILALVLQSCGFNV